jgi:hypothetical protein
MVELTDPRFSAIFQEQLDFTKKVLGVRGISLDTLTETQRIDLTREYLLSLHKELSEILDCVGWKKHRKTNELTFTENVGEEILDVQKYLLGLASIWGIDADQFVEMFWKKSFVVNERFRTEHIQISMPLAIIDIDNVLFDYTPAFMSWVLETSPTIGKLSKSDNPALWETLKCKYRLEKGEIEGKPADNAVETLKALKQAGWAVVLMTYRPIKIFKGLEHDTLRWLKDNNFEYDKIIWTAYEKAFYLTKEMTACSIFVDDELDTCRAVASLGKRVYRVVENLNGNIEKFQEITNIGELLSYEGIRELQNNLGA